MGTNKTFTRFVRARLSLSYHDQAFLIVRSRVRSIYGLPFVAPACLLHVSYTQQSHM